MLFKFSCVLLLWLASVASTNNYCRKKCGKECEKHCVTGCLYYSHTCFCNTLSYFNYDTKECYIKPTVAVVSGNSIVFPQAADSSNIIQLTNPHKGRINSKTIISKDFLPNSILITTFKSIEDSKIMTAFRHFDIAKWGSVKLNKEAVTPVAGNISAFNYCSSLTSTLYIIENNKTIYQISNFTYVKYNKMVVAEIEGTSHLVLDCCLGYLFVTSTLTLKIYRIDVNTLETKEIVSSKRPTAIAAIDRLNRRIYWTENNNKLFYSDYNGSGIHLLANLQQSPFDMVYFDTFLYWTSSEDKIVYKTSAINGNTTVFFVADRNVYSIAVAGSIQETSGHWSDWFLRHTKSCRNKTHIRYCQRNVTLSICSNNQSNVQWKCYSKRMRRHVEEGSNETMSCNDISEKKSIRKGVEDKHSIYLILTLSVVCLAVLVVLLMIFVFRKYGCQDFWRLTGHYTLCPWNTYKKRSSAFVISRGKEHLIIEDDEISLKSDL